MAARIMVRCCNWTAGAVACLTVALWLPGDASATPSSSVRIHTDQASAVLATSASARGPVEKLNDGRPDVGWVSAVDETIGVRIDLRFPHTRYLTGIELTPPRGNHRLAARPARVRIIVGTVVHEMTLPDRSRRQRLDWPVAAVDRVSIEVLEVHGNYRRVGLNEVGLFEVKTPLSSVEGLAEAVEADIAGLDGTEASRKRLIARGMPAAVRLRGWLATAPTAQCRDAIAVLTILDLNAARAWAAKNIDVADLTRSEIALEFFDAHDGAHAADLALAALARAKTDTEGLQALELLAARLDPRVLPSLARALQSENAELADRAAQLVAGYGAAAIPILNTALRHKEPRRRASAIRAMAQVSPASVATRRLAEIIAADDAEDAVAAVRALARLRPKGAVRVLRSVLDEARPHASVALASLVDAGLVSPTPSAWGSKLSHIQGTRVLAGLTEIQTTGARRVLIEALIQPSAGASFHIAAADALAAHGARGLEALMQSLSDAPRDSASLSLYLGQMRTAHGGLMARWLGALPAVPMLDRARIDILEALRDNRERRYATSVYALYRRPDMTPRLRREALEALGSLGSPAIARQLADELDRLADGLWSIRFAAALSAGDGPTRASLFDRAARIQPDVWAPEVIVSLGRIDPTRAYALFGRRFMFTGKRAQLAILEVAYRAGTRESLVLLYEGATSRDGALRRRALHWLRLPRAEDPTELDPPKTVGALFP